MQGPIPASIDQLSHLRELNLAENALTGPLPADMVALTHLHVLAVSKNKLNGELPDFLDDLDLLHEIFASDCNFVGPLPTFNTQPSLYRLQLQNNALTGVIPSDFLGLTVNGSADSVVVDLSGNELSGDVPASLDALQDVALQLNLADNAFTSVASELCDNDSWNDGSTADYGCDAILCPAASFALAGRATGASECVLCGNVWYMGSTICLQQDDRSVLQALYVATGGSESWKQTDGWLDEDISHCDWYGVECYEENDLTDGRVKSLQLSNNGLRFTIPETIFNMEHLVTLNFGRNAVVLPFARFWASPHVRTINIASTHTTDFDGIQEANEFFAYLYADHLPIDGSLPKEILQIRSLQVFSMADSGLMGELDQMVGQMESLQELYLYGNELHGPIPASIQYLSDLRVLSLAKNQFQGPLPAALGNLLNLEAVSLADQVTKGGGLTGPLLSFDAAEGLTSLVLSDNKFDGTIPVTLLSAVAQEARITLDLANNLIGGTVPGALDRFNHMNIYLEGNEISEIDSRLCSKKDWMDGLVGEYKCDAIMCPLDTSGGRQVFADGACQTCTGEKSETGWIGQGKCGGEEENLSERAILERLYNRCGGVGWHNQNNWLTDGNFCTWYGITCDASNSVQDIVLGANQLIGFLPTELYQLPKLEKISVYSNSVAVSFQGIENAETLKTLILDATDISSLEGIGEARSLEELSVRFNNLEGKIPEEMAGLVNLNALTLSDNNLTGEIPFWISTMPSLAMFLAANNKLSGPVYDFADMPGLKYIDLSGNKLRGKIPSTLLQTASANEKLVVDLSSNKITGTVPGELQRFSSLSIHLANNRITDIDAALCQLQGWNDNDVRSFGCDGILCPEGFANAAGRQTSSSHPCIQCDAATYMGSTACAANAVLSSGATMPTLSLAGVASLVAAIMYFM